VRFVALAAGSDIELYDLTLVEGLVTTSFDIGEMNEYIVRSLTGDKAVALLRIENLTVPCATKNSFRIGRPRWPDLAQQCMPVGAIPRAC